MQDFLKSLGFERKDIEGNSNWELLERLFYKNINSSTGNIPKIFHHIWLGGGLPPNYDVIEKSFKENNPDWELKLWRELDIEKLNLENKSLYNDSTNYGLKSDIARYEILYKYGGVFTDTDFICKKSFNDLTQYDFFGGAVGMINCEIFNGLFGCSKNNEILNKVINELKVAKLKNMNYDKIIELTGPKFFTKVIFDSIDENTDNFIIFTNENFYPFTSLERFDIRGRKYDENVDRYVSRNSTENTYAIHLWYSTWQK